MSGNENTGAWREIITFPLGARQTKPRTSGLTMILDKGIGLGEIRDLLQINSEYIDFLKLGFGTSALYSEGILEEKIALTRSFNVEIYPGGTFFEVALWQNKTREFLYKCKSLGFTTIEISDGTISLSREVRERAINMAAEMGFRVLTEVGKKNDGPEISVHTLAQQALQDLNNGAYKVIMEGRECGLNVGLYDKKGKMASVDMEILLNYISNPGQIIWETPLKSQQQDLIKRFGPDVNLGNIQAQEVLALEALRVGLRADTFQFVTSDTIINII